MSGPPSSDALHDDLGPETLARVLDGLRALPARDPRPRSEDEPGDAPAVPLPRRR